MRNASGLTAADLAHAQGFRECAEILSNAQNLQQNLAQSNSQHTGFCLNGTSQNGENSTPIIQGRSFLNGAPNRKRSFDGMEVNQIKKARTNGLGIPPGMLNGNGPLGHVGEVQMESVSMELAAAVSSGGPGPFALGLNGFAPVQGLGPMDQSEDQVAMDRSTPPPKELEIITVTSMQIPCRCTNSYAYL